MKTFNEKCYAKLREVPRGRITTYKELAHALGSGAYRAVGTAMKNNPEISKTPCHRGVNSDGGVGEYAAGGQNVKTEILKKEEIEIQDGRVVDFEKKLFVF